MCTVKDLLVLALGSLLFSPVFGEVISENLIASTNQFSLQLLKTLFTEGKGANLLISPVNLYNALVIAQQGSRGNTQAELDKFLNSEPDEAKKGYANLTAVLKGKHDNAVLEWGNCVFLKEGVTINNDFSHTIFYNLSGDIEHVNFEQTQAAVKFINGWVTWLDHNTQRNMVDVSDLPVDTQLLFGNAVFFSSPWKNGFNSEESTLDGSFETLDGTTIQRPIMHLEADLIAGQNTDIGATFVLLPFLGEEFSLLVVVPDEKGGLNDVLDTLEGEQLLSIIRSAEYRHVSLSLPRINLLNTLSIKSELQKLGVNEIFQTTADLSGLAETPVVLEDIRQTVALELNESGAVFSTISNEPEKKKDKEEKEKRKNNNPGSKYEDLDVNADHPYLLFLVNKDNAVPVLSAWDGGMSA